VVVGLCAICEKHQQPGPLVSPVAWATPDVVVTHRPADADGLGVIGYLFVEPRRHVQTWDRMSVDEVEAVARAALLAARCLRTLLAPVAVPTMIGGRQAPHVHQHVFVRHSGTPDDVDWLTSPSWAGAPRVPADDLEAFAHQVGDAATALCRDQR
jgi:ATP adenylyltransferase